MKILVLGGDGMLGHVLLRDLSKRYDVKVTLRNNLDFYKPFGLYDRNNTYDEFDPGDFFIFQKILCEYRPAVVINALGIVKQREKSLNNIALIEINSLLPHKLAQACSCISARLIHFSTDCVFSGERGMYSETDIPDATEMYGRTKYLGECHYDNSVTLRTSFFGPELRHKTGLIEWFCAQSGTIQGFSKAVYSGLLTSEIGHVIERIMIEKPNLSGLWHLSSDPIDKYTLLCKLSEYLGRDDISIKVDETYKCDRSLDSSKFRKEVGYHPPSWEDMLKKLAKQIIEGYKK